MPINDADMLAAITDAIPVETPPENTDDTGNNDADADENADGAGEGGSGADNQPADVQADDKETGDGADTDTESAALDEAGKAAAAEAAKAGDNKDEIVAGAIDPKTGKPYTEEQVAAAATEKAEKARKEFLAEQERDPINSPIPKYLKEPTQKRMRALVDIAKDTTAKLESAMKDRNEIIGMITETGANAVQYRAVLNYLGLVNSGDPAKIKQAISTMQQELQILSRMSGTPVPGVDHLAEHPDLKQQVAAGTLNPQLAEEIAATRNRETFQTRSTEHARAETEAQQRQAQVEHANGISALNDIGRQLAARDPNYRAVAVEVLKQVQPQMAKAHPSQWAQMFLLAYSAYKPAAAPVVRRTTPSAVPKNQPLRGNNPSGGQQSAPKSFEDAINMGIAAGTRR